MRLAAAAGAAILFVTILPVAGDSAAGQDLRSATPEQLRAWLRQYPDADADGDGELTIEEARAYRRRTGREQAAQADPAFAHEFTFATVSDGVKIALAVGYPRGFDEASGRRWPAIFTLCGYPSSVPPIDPGAFAHRCVTVNCSVRGTGASGGALKPWDERTWRDGYEIIEEWIVRQPWSNGRVGIVGHSWPGLMGFLVASTAPPSLKAVCVSGLIEDAYAESADPGASPTADFPSTGSTASTVPREHSNPMPPPGPYAASMSRPIGRSSRPGRPEIFATTCSGG